MNGRIVLVRWRRWFLCVVSASMSCACAAATTSASTTPAAAPTAHVAALLLAPGIWAEYWAVNGGVDTQRYLFREDGRFEWRAPTQAPPNTALYKSGTFQLEESVGASTLVLNVTVESFAACSAQCSHHDDGPRRVQHASPIVERHEIGECAPNLEAQALDAHYACRAIGGHAFWRRTAPQAKELADFAE